MFEDIIDFIQKTYKTKNFYRCMTKFFGNEKKYINECIDSTFVSSVGKYVDIFEKKIANILVQDMLCNQQWNICSSYSTFIS